MENKKEITNKEPKISKDLKIIIFLIYVIVAIVFLLIGYFVHGIGNKNYYYIYRRNMQSHKRLHKNTKKNIAISDLKGNISNLKNGTFNIGSTTVLMNKFTKVYNNGNLVKISTLANSDTVNVIGEKLNGKFIARFIIL
jgi:hypothetical protein